MDEQQVIKKQPSPFIAWTNTTSVSTPTTCTYCEPLLKAIPSWHKLPKGVRIITSHSLRTLETTSWRCHLCALFLADYKSRRLSNVPKERYCIGVAARYRSDAFKGIRLAVASDDSRGRIVTVAVVDFFEVAAVENQALPRLIAPSNATDSEQSWNVARNWIKKCTNKHEACRESVLSGNPPTRLLYVGSSTRELRLCLSKDLRPGIKYLTLSHCWGLKPFVTLAQSNLDSFMNNIPFDILSKTFRDAVISTQRLGFEYLWIDSLCIIQKDQSDWATESTNMGAIYANSTVTLSAIDSSESATGLFFKGYERGHLGYRIQVPTTSDGTTSLSTWDCIPGSTSRLFNTNKLSLRAWAFQELFLSRRTLRFGRDELSWECRTLRAFETSPYSAQPYDRSMVSLLSTKMDTAHNSTDWFDVVQPYSKGNLTFASDKLVALSGISDLFALRSGKTYIAGLWKEDFVRQLLWKPVSPSEKRPQKSRIPSWSWASLDGEISLGPLSGPSLAEKVPLVHVEKYSDGSLQVERAVGDTSVCLRTEELVSCTVTVNNVQAGSIGFRYNGQHVAVFSWLDGPSNCRIFFDVSSPETKDIFFLLELFPGRGLALKLRLGGVFSRVGTFEAGWYLPPYGDIFDPWNETPNSDREGEEVNSLIEKKRAVLGKGYNEGRTGLNVKLI